VGRGGRPMTPDDAVQVIADAFASEGAQEYLGEPVTQAAHMLQTAALAERDRAGDALIAAALLHDVGHFTGIVSGHDPMRGADDRHQESGAFWLAQWFGPQVTEPVRLHVAAKRYLCAVDADYVAALSQASVDALRVQGGPMQAAEIAAFDAEPYAQAALRLRRWDDAAKDPGALFPPFDHFRPLLRALVRQDAAGEPGQG
jgi:gamma-butyrobetaine dioxygenase